MKKENWNLIGNPVLVSHVYDLEREDKNNKRTWIKRKINKRVGWLIGFRTIYNGIIKNGILSGPFQDDYSPPYLDVTEKVKCALVVFTPYTNPVKVPIYSYTLTKDIPSPIKSDMSEEDRKLLSEESKNYPRDKKGRFVKP